MHFGEKLAECNWEGGTASFRHPDSANEHLLNTSQCLCRDTANCAKDFRALSLEAHPVLEVHCRT
jgi:hypothetical protein